METEINLNKNQNESVLVLGSKGQIGSALVSFLTSLNFNVHEFDIVNHPSEDLRNWPNRLLEKLIKQSKYVFFLAFDVGGSTYLEKYQDTFDFSNNNLRIMSNTFTLLSKYKTPFLFASSQMASMTYSNYGLLKQIGEKMANSLGGRVVHFWNVYGHETDPSKFHVISDFILSALESNTIKMRTTGEESRDFLYVSDCCEALKMVMDHHYIFPTNMKLHIATGKFYKIIEVAEIIAHELNATIQKTNKTDSLQKNAKNMPDLALQEFWKPQVSLEEGIREIIVKMKSTRE